MATVKQRVVLDTNQIIAAGSKWLESGTPYPVTPVQQFIYNVVFHHTALYSSSIAAEYLKKLIDKKHPNQRVIQYLGCILETFELVIITMKQCSHLPADPDDLHFILCAIEGNANYLVTEDNHLLVLKPHYNPPVIGKRDELAHLFHAATPAPVLEVSQEAKGNGR